MLQKLVVAICALISLLLFKVGFFAYFSSFIINGKANCLILSLSYIPIFLLFVSLFYKKNKAEFTERKARDLQMVYPESMSSDSLSYGSDTPLNRLKSDILSTSMTLIILGSFIYVMLYGVINLIHDFTDIEQTYTIYNVSLSNIDCTEVTPLKSLCTVMAQSDDLSLDKIYIPESISDDLTDGDFQLRMKDTLVGKSVVGHRQQ